jgi:DNA replication licensing factor MCM5
LTDFDREQLKKNAREGKFFLRVSLEHILNFDEPLSALLRRQPTQVLPALEKAIQRVFKNHSMDEDQFEEPRFQLQVTSSENPRMLRDLQSNLMGQLVVVPGIVTAASKTMIKSTEITVRCSNCSHEKQIKMKQGFAGTQLPRQCDQMRAAGPDKPMCPLDPYRIIPDKSVFMDQQRLKLQEAPELIPTGEMPRSLQMVVDRELTDKVTPGNRVKVVGILSIHSSAKGGSNNDERVNSSFLRVIGL